MDRITNPTTDKPLTYATRPVPPAVVEVLRGLVAGQRIRITQTVRVGLKSWPAVVEGVFRHIDSLATGLATDRVPEDDIIVPLVHFTKDTGELSSIAVDENTRVEVVTPPPTGSTAIVSGVPPAGG